MTLSRRACLLALTAFLLVAFPASAAAPNGGWKGKTEQGSTLYMTIKRGKVTRFSANVNMFCTNGGGLKSRMLYHDRPVRIRNGRFKFEGEGKDGATYEFAGRLASGRSKASGTLGFHDGSWSPSGMTFCNANDVKWTAKRR